MQIYLYLLGNLDGFHLGTWTVFTWELGRILLGNLDYFAWELGLFFTIYLYIPQ